MSTDYYILKEGEGGPEWSSLPYGLFKKGLKGAGLQIVKNREGSLVLTDGSDYLHLGISSDRKDVVSFTRFGGNNAEGILDAIGSMLQPGQYISSEHDDDVNDLISREME